LINFKANTIVTGMRTMHINTVAGPEFWWSLQVYQIPLI